MRISDWSSDVCSSDLRPAAAHREDIDAILEQEAAVEELRLERQPVARPQRARGAVAEVAVLVIADAGQGRRQGVAGLPVRPCGQRPGKPGHCVFVERAFCRHRLPLGCASCRVSVFPYLYIPLFAFSLYYNSSLFLLSLSSS